MRFQSRKFTCGPAAICNALEVYDVYKTEDEVAKLCKTTTEGTSSRGIVSGLRLLGYSALPIKHRDATKARGEISTRITLGFPQILCVDNWSHWIAVVGSLNGKVVIADAASPHLILYPKWENLMERWKYTGSRYEGYAITHD